MSEVRCQVEQLPCGPARTCVSNVNPSLVNHDIEQDNEMETKSVRQTEERQDRQDRNKPKLQLTVARGSITDLKSPVVVVGSYKGIAPAGALKALDDEVDQWISRAVDQGMVGGDLGQLFFVPVPGKQIRAGSILLAGMGEFGRFSYHALRYLAMNICLAVSALKVGRFATVLIGSGEGNLEMQDAAKGFLSGICDALHRLDPDERVAEFTIVEFKKERHAEILQVLKGLIPKIDNVDITLAETSVRGRKGKKVITGAVGTRQPTIPTFVNRITIERAEEGYSFSALTNTAVVPVREVNVRPFFTEGIATELKDGSGPESHETFGRLLHHYIFPQDFERMIDDGNALTLVVDKDTAGLPWEMACFGPKDRRRYFGPDLKLTRQFRTMLSGAPGIAPPINKSLRILIIADPAPDLPLDGAAKEGLKVKTILEEYQELFKGQVKIDIEARIGPKDCKPVEILALILNQTWDIVHYSGHGIFDPAKPNDSGWVFSEKVTLSAREIFRVPQVPRLVFANACFSAVCHDGVAPAAEDSNRKLAGLAEAFFERGVQNYIGTGWKVVDDEALEFAEVFYSQALMGRLLGEALAEARLKIFDLGSTWGAYQHYGQSNVRLV